MLNYFLSLFLKDNCPLCQRTAENTICSYCQQKLHLCQLNSPPEFTSDNFLIFAWGKYEGNLKRAIASLKYDGNQNLGQLMGQWLGKQWLNLGYKEKYPLLTVTPIPLHSEKLKTRGFNQAELIARGFCQITRYYLKPHLVKRVKNTEAMFGLTATAREKNIQKAFDIGADFAKINLSHPVLIIDDIYTTGTTVKEAKKTLDQHQINTIGVATVSRTKNSGSLTVSI